jgi:hypothetical protein
MVRVEELRHLPGGFYAVGCFVTVSVFRYAAGTG